MDSKRSTQNLIVERRYKAQEEECAKALKVLLKRAVAGTSDDGNNASKEIETNDRDATASISR